MRSVLMGLLLVAVSSVAQAQQCLPMSEAEAMANLEAQAKELPLFRGLLITGADIVVTVNQETGSFTVILVSPDKTLICPAASGTQFRPIARSHGKPS